MRILVADEMHPSLMPMLRRRGFEVTYRPDITRAQLLNDIGPYEGLFIRSKTTLDEDFLVHATRLRFVGRAGAGLDQIDVPAMVRRGIHLMNAPEGNRDAVAEHAVGLLLGLLNHLSRADQQVRQGIWQREANRGTEIGGKTVGIVGYGNTGQAFARRLRGFGCRVLAHDPYLAQWPNRAARPVPMDDLFARADVVSLHVPLTDQTRGLVNHTWLAQFQKPIYLLNTARGEVVNHADLLEALKYGRVRGAGLDVLENEKLDRLTAPQRATFEALAKLDAVLFSPHVAGWTHESYRRINRVLVTKLTQWWATRDATQDIVAGYGKEEIR